MKQKLVDEIKSSDLNIPNHIAIIMDGNGRWANSFAKPRVWGHHKGARAVRKTIETCRAIGVKYLTLYAFSDENWARPEYEVDTIMDLLFRYLKKEESNLDKNNIRLKVIGEVDRLPRKTRDQLDATMENLKHNNGMTLVLALSYGSKNEIVSAVKSVAEKVKSGELSPEDITGSIIEENLWTTGMPAPDLLIRTSGEQRLSNFLLWQLAYSEFYFTDTCWPDFDEQALYDALLSFNHRERRYGLVAESRPLSQSEITELSQEGL